MADAPKFFDTEAGGATIGAVGSLASGALNQLFYEHNTSSARRWSERMTQQERDYNTPAAQMQRFRDAGLNPNLIYGQTNEGGTITASPQGLQGNFDIPSGISAGASLASARLASAQARNVDADTALKQQQHDEIQPEQAKYLREQIQTERKQQKQLDTNTALGRKEYILKEQDIFKHSFSAMSSTQQTTFNSNSSAFNEQLTNASSDSGSTTSSTSKGVNAEIGTETSVGASFAKVIKAGASISAKAGGHLDKTNSHTSSGSISKEHQGGSEISSLSTKTYQALDKCAEELIASVPVKISNRCLEYALEEGYFNSDYISTSTADNAFISALYAQMYLELRYHPDSELSKQYKKQIIHDVPTDK